MKKIVVFGAGGHAKVVIDIALLMGYQVLAVFDDDNSKQGQSVLGIPVVGNQQQLISFAQQHEIHHFFVALGHNALRLQLAQKFIAANLLPVTLIHPKATIAASANIGLGTVVMAGACINADVIIGHQVIINTSAVIEHDCIVADGVHLAPTTALCGAVQVGQQTLIGVGAKVLPAITIGEQVMIGAGAVVINHIPSWQKVVGIPAKALGN
ncbi:MAG: acetyltransferase [Agitococcus sp.]